MEMTFMPAKLMMRMCIKGYGNHKGHGGVGITLRAPRGTCFIGAEATGHKRRPGNQFLEDKNP
jgi:hypothetical protein